MYVPEEIVDKADETMILSIVSKYKSLDYSQRKNYEKLCEEYRYAVDDKNKKLSEELYRIMYCAQKDRASKSGVFLRKNNNKIKPYKKKIKKTVVTYKTVKQTIIDDLVENQTNYFSTGNIVAFLYHRRNIEKNKNKIVTDKEISEQFNCSVIEAYNALEYATKLNIVNKYNDKGYSIKKLPKIEENGLKKYIRTTNGEILEKLKDEIEKSGPTIGINTYRKKKKKKIISIPFSRNGGSGINRESNMPFLATEYSSNHVDSMRETGHGRKKTAEYTKSMAIENSRSRYGLKDEKPILDFDLD